jgi:hypothetical protein
MAGSALVISFTPLLIQLSNSISVHCLAELVIVDWVCVKNCCTHSVHGVARDIGEWQANGAFKITHREENIFKLSQGEYVPGENLGRSCSILPYN